jgi:hypothetical protein
VWYKDADGDGYSDGTTVMQCERPEGTYYLTSELTATSGDCDDTDAGINPARLWYKDADGDGYSDGTTVMQCERPEGPYYLASELTATSGDCDDAAAGINPETVWYKDADGDGYSDGSSVTQCERPTDYYLASELTATSGDCDDTVESVYPGATEIPNDTIDQDCNGYDIMDADLDGLPDEQEWGPEGNDPDYDGNGDGIPDSVQNNVISMPTFDGLNYVTLESSPGTTISNVLASDNPSPADAPDVDFPYGFYSFTVNGVVAGGTTTVTLYYPAGGITPSTYYKYGPTTPGGQNEWYEFMWDDQTKTGAVIDELNNNIILHFVDGQRGDDDVSGKGSITDIGAPAFTSTGTTTTSGGGSGGCFIASSAHNSSSTMAVLLLPGICLLAALLYLGGNLRENNPLK